MADTIFVIYDIEVFAKDWIVKIKKQNENTGRYRQENSRCRLAHAIKGGGFH